MFVVKMLAQMTQRTRQLFLLSIGLLAVLIGVEAFRRFTEPALGCPPIEQLRSADPAADALAAAKHGDVHLLMLGGYVGEIPGRGDSKLPVQLIEGTEDTTTLECIRLRPYAEDYARRYNEAVLSAAH